MRIKKKNVVGTARVFIPQRKAMRKLQLSLKDFRRLCILKGVYPREPKHIKKANKGSTKTKIYYHLKDILHLCNEPLINKFREQKAFFRRLSTARMKKETAKKIKMLANKPDLHLDGLVRERYPTFDAAIDDLDDALCLCFAFAALARSKVARHFVIRECKRLSTEFMHYVIESNSLRKVFVSIKGIYYQAEIMGKKVTWVVGHERSVARTNELDLSVMATFVDFYLTMLSFVNFRLYKNLGLFYPPKLDRVRAENDYFNAKEDELEEEKIYSLAVPINHIKKDEEEEVMEIDTFDNDVADLDGNNLADKLKQAANLRLLFSKFRFFLNREVPKDPLTFVIRSCGGAVGWDGCPITLLSERSSLITHHIVDRNIANFNANRVYIQPQWIFDCFNARRLLPTSIYAPGIKLPPHLSPFVEETAGDYIPIEKLNQLRESGQDISRLLGESKKEKENKTKTKKPSAKAVSKKDVKNEEQKDCEKSETKSGSKMKVKVGKVFKESQQKNEEEQNHNLKLREMMIPKKFRRVYKKIKFGEKRKAREVRKLQSKRTRSEA